MEIITCLICNKEVRRLSRNVKKTKNHYCSSECYQEARKGKTIICFQCGKSFYRVDSRITRNSNNFCSKECCHKYQAQFTPEEIREKDRRRAAEWYKDNKEIALQYSAQRRKEHPEIMEEYRRINAEKLKEQSKKWQEKNAERLSELRKSRSEEHKIYAKQYREKNIDRITKYWKEYRANNPDKIKEKDLRYRQNNPEGLKKICERRNKKRRSNIMFRVSDAISRAVAHSLRDGKGGKRWESLLNYTVKDLMIHLETQFADGMSWQNQGQWHIDHILPISFFEFDSPKDVEFKYCWGLSNLQPMWASENESKGNRIDYKRNLCD